MINQKEKEIELLKQHCAVGGRVEISDDEESDRERIKEGLVGHVLVK